MSLLFYDREGIQMDSSAVCREIDELLPAFGEEIGFSWTTWLLNQLRSHTTDLKKILTSLQESCINDPSRIHYERILAIPLVYMISRGITVVDKSSAMKLFVFKAYCPSIGKTFRGSVMHTNEVAATRIFKEQIPPNSGVVLFDYIHVHYAEEAVMLNED